MLNEVVDEISNGIEIEIIKTVECGIHRNLEGFHAGSRIKDFFIFLSRNRFIVTTNENKLSLYDSQSFDLIREIPSMCISSIIKLNEEVLIIAQRNHDQPESGFFSVYCYSVGEICDGKLEPSHSFCSSKFQTRRLGRINDDRFFSLYPSYRTNKSMNYPLKCNYIELFSFPEKKLIKTIELRKMNLEISSHSVITISKKYKDCVYFTFYSRVNHLEIITLVNLSSESEIKTVEASEDIDQIYELQVYKNRKNGDELVVIVGSDFGYICEIINFSKKKPETEKVIRRSQFDYRSLEKCDCFESSAVLEDQIMFIGDDCFGQLIGINLRNNRKCFNKSVLKRSKPSSRIHLKKIEILSFSKEWINLVCVGDKDLSFVKIRGIKFEFVSKKENIWRNDLKERISFLFDSKECYLHQEEMKKNVFFEVKLVNMNIKSILKIMF